MPRHEFVPAAGRDDAYLDSPLPIGYGQTISQPYIVALMTELARPSPTDRVLEVGTGSGYQAAVISRLVARVFSVELVEPLAESAASVLRRLGYANVTVRSGDGYLGWPDEAPFDVILVTAAPEAVPAALVAQLKPGGRLVVPVGPVHDVQDLQVIEKDAAGRVSTRSVIPVRFVPMVKKRAGRQEAQFRARSHCRRADCSGDLRSRRSSRATAPICAPILAKILRRARP